MSHLFGDLPKYKIISEMEEKEQEQQEPMLKIVKRGFCICHNILMCQILSSQNGINFGNRIYR